MSWDEKIAKELGSHHSDSLAVIRMGKSKAKRRTNKRNRIKDKQTIQEARADLLLRLENAGITDSWQE